MSISENTSLIEGAHAATTQSRPSDIGFDWDQRTIEALENLGIASILLQTALFMDGTRAALATHIK